MDSELSVVAAAIKVCLVQLHCDVDPSDTVRACRPYASAVRQKNEKRSVHWTKSWLARVESRAIS